MSQYHTFTAHDAVAYAQQFAGIDNPSELVSACLLYTSDAADE